jgi:hypothetical protein
MAFVRYFAEEELNELGKLADEEITYFNVARDTDLLKREIRRKYTRNKELSGRQPE